ncbi:NADP-dependent oxidoreductase [Paenibacillus donghaensis]|uniref:NADPH:quinone reductase n=1 Tax=Paenibacillus donghaensis TaxID=414771 RepID=A0A2Z2KP26_9BACL|nr:NADP-dependent oxidoreductase [Paenibacillus donghaensis]ASA26275.1 NADPH:quinone reductase [Paenibacillus donghaensis]
MKAVVIEQFGGPEVLVDKEIPKPVIGPNQVLIRLRATSVNPVDFKIRQGAMGQSAGEFPLVLGGDVAGVVAEVGDSVSRFKVDERVFARPRSFGTYAEYIAVDADVVSRMPKALNFEEAAAVPLAAMTAWQALVDHGKIKAGDKVLIHAGAGGVGSFAIQLAKHFGAEVASTASSRNQELLESLGVDHFIDYKKADFSQVLSDYDLVLDTMGGDIQAKSFEILKPGGRLVSLVEKPDDKLQEKYQVTGVQFMMEPKGSQLEQLAELADQGILRPVIDSMFWLNEEGVRQAHEKSETHHAVGKIVIRSEQ